MPTNASTPFPLGAYLGNPDNSSTAKQALFDANFADFTRLMGASPAFMASFVDQRQGVSQWVGNSMWAADSAAQSANARGMTPVIALPLSTLASGSPSAAQQYEVFASGQYDGVVRDIVKVWAQRGFSNLVFRPGWEMNLQGPTYAGDDAQSQAAWVRAFQHVSTVLHQAATANGVNVQVVWNPGVTNYTNALATTNLYPGDAYVDIIGADMYSDIHPYSDGGATPSYHDWHTGGQDSTVAQFIADPVNRAHYWSLPAATRWSDDGSGGHSQSLASLIAFAKQHNKPFAIPETGAGNSDAGTDVADDAAFPQWLAQQLAAAGVPLAFVNLWDSNGGGNYKFSAPSDNKPSEAAAWAKYFGAIQTAGPVSLVGPVSPAAVTVGSGPDTLALLVSEDAWQGDAQYTVSVDGRQVGGVQTATASHAGKQPGVVNVLGSFGAGSHAVSVNFLNDAYGGTAATDRNLYVDGAALNGKAIAGSSLALQGGGAQGFWFTGAAATAAAAAITLGSGADTLALQVSEDAWQGDAQYTVSVDGKQVGGVQTATASHAAGQVQQVNVLGSFGTGAHSVSVNFLNDGYGGTAATDRNLYVNNAALNGTAVPDSSLALMSNGTQGFSFAAPNAAGVNTLRVRVSEDAWNGHAQFTVAVDGAAVGGVRTASASHAAGASEEIALLGNWGAGPHSVAIAFINDAYGGTSVTDRNLYVETVTYDGKAASGGPASLLSNGTATFGVAGPSVSAAVTLRLAEDAWQGDAQYAVSIDGGPVLKTGVVTASNAAGASQAVLLQTTLTAGKHDLAVSFLNDAYGGTSATDRNLYVKGIDVNGTPVAGGSGALLSTGTSHFEVFVSVV